MKKRIKINSKLRIAISSFSSFISLMAAGQIKADVLTTDPVENDGTWNVSGNAAFFISGTVAGISPTAGVSLMHLQNLGGREATKSFTGITLEPGVYTVNFDIGNFTNGPFAEFNVGLTGLTANGVNLVADSSSSTVPADGDISTWSRTYNIEPGDPNIGETIGFRMSLPNTGDSRNASFDNLSISYAAVPETSSTLLLCTGLGAIAGRRQRKK